MYHGLNKQTAGVVHAGKDSHRSRSSTLIPDSRQTVTLFPQDRYIVCDELVK